MTKSSVAAIVDEGQGVRVVITQRWRMNNHVKKGERLFVVPDLEVDESSLEWTDYPRLIATAQAHLLKELAPTNVCGECRQCCITMFIADRGDGFTKPSHFACRELCDQGCSRYWNRPQTCRTFECVWLKSQGGNRAMDAGLRPDRCGSILTDHDEGSIRVHVDQSKPKSEALQAFIDERQAEGERYETVTHYYGETK